MLECVTNLVCVFAFPKMDLFSCCAARACRVEATGGIASIQQCLCLRLRFVWALLFAGFKTGERLSYVETAILLLTKAMTACMSPKERALIKLNPNIV